MAFSRISVSSLEPELVLDLESSGYNKPGSL